MKGGVGKTTLTFNLAACLAEDHDRKVLVIDLDPQFSLTQYMVPRKQYETYIKLVQEGKQVIVSDIFYQQPTLPSMVNPQGITQVKPVHKLRNFIIPIPTANGQLDLIPSHLELGKLSTIEDKAVAKKLNEFIKVHAESQYDFIFIDCPPTLSIFTASAFVACDAILIPIKPDNLSSLGIPLLASAFGEYSRDSGVKPKELGIVFNMVSLNTNLMPRIMAQVQNTYRSQGKYVFENYMRQGISIARSVEDNTPIIKFSQAKRYWPDIRGVTEEFLNRANKEFHVGGSP